MIHRRLGRSWLVALGGVCVLLGLVPVAGAKTINVAEGQSIQTAVDSAVAGDTILVAAGVYRESVVVAKSGVTIQGQNAVLAAPTTPVVNQCVDPSAPAGVNGFCVIGDVDFDTGTVNSYVENVTITGFQINDFGASGIVAYGAKGAVFQSNRAVDNAEYGIAAFFSTGTQVVDNSTTRSGEAGIYIGSSPEARALVDGNTSTDNEIGIFVRDALRGTIRDNRATGNCVGVVFLADAPGPAGQMTVAKNTIRKNSKACAANEEEQQPPVSGVGVALFGANGVVIKKNVILDNKPGGPTAYSGGVILLRDDPQGSAPTNNRITGNRIQRNKPDLFWDKSGHREPIPKQRVHHEQAEGPLQIGIAQGGGRANGGICARPLFGPEVVGLALSGDAPRKGEHVRATSRRFHGHPRCLLESRTARRPPRQLRQGCRRDRRRRGALALRRRLDPHGPDRPRHVLGRGPDGKFTRVIIWMAGTNPLK